MSSTGATFNPEQIIVERLQGRVGELTQCLNNFDIAGAFSVIEHINATKEESIYYGLGLLARGLHTAIVTFQVDDHGKAYLAHDAHGAAPVTSQLDNVVQMSEESARKTLNILDSSMPLMKELLEGAASIEKKVGGKDKELDAQLKAQLAGLSLIEGNMMQILMAQGFQDLSGQAIKKVNKILDVMQKDLVALLTYANQVKSMSEPVPVKFPAIGELGESEAVVVEDEAPKDAAMAQNDVDDLLSSLGF